MKFPKLTKQDKIAVVILIVFLILVTIPTYISKGECEVARPGYKCESAENVMIENCVYWGEFNCDTNSDISLEQVEWYIGHLCDIHNQYHSAGLDCVNLKLACNQITGSNTCPIG